MQRTTTIAGILLVALAVAWKWQHTTRPPASLQGSSATLHGSSMGTRWTLAWRGNAPANLERRVTGVLDHWEQVLSQWRPDSDLSRFNQGAPASRDLQRVIELAEAVRHASGGAFDHNILHAVHEAGFGPDGNGIDLSAIGKGFAADRVAEMLRSLGVNDFIFELGGEVIAGDQPWPVAIEAPSIATSQPARTITLRRAAVATSGNYRQFLPGPHNSLKSHIIDPRTRQPVLRPPCSVTVTASDCATADAWATAAFVLGPNATLPTGVTATWQGTP